MHVYFSYSPPAKGFLSLLLFSHSLDTLLRYPSFKINHPPLCFSFSFPFWSASTFTPSDTSGINLSFNLLTVHRTFASFSAHFLINLSFFLVLLERPPYPFPLFPFSNLSLPLFLASPKGAKVGITFSWPSFSLSISHTFIWSVWSSCIKLESDKAPDL